MRSCICFIICIIFCTFRIFRYQYPPKQNKSMLLPHSHKLTQDKIHSAHVTRHIVKATCTPLHEIIPSSAASANWHSISVHPHCFPINPYWELAHAPICRHQNAICLWKFIVFAITADSFPLATPRNEITLFNSLFAYITYGALEGNTAGFVCTRESRLGCVFASY